MNIKDIAKLAGVGVGTVSRVINNQAGVKASTRERIEKIIDDTDYIPNTSARNLKRSKSLAIGVLIRGGSSPFLSEILYSIESHLIETPYKIVVHYLHSSEQNDVQEAERFIVEWKLKGLICLGGSYEKVNTSRLAKYDLPIVFSSVDDHSIIDAKKFGVIAIDNVDTSYKGTQFLIGKGHKHIGLLSAKEVVGSIGRQRRFGYEKALAEAGLAVDEDFIVRGDYNLREGYRCMMELVKQAPAITAVFATTDELAIGALRYLHEIERDDIDVLGFDGLKMGEFSVPTLTTMAQPAEEIGRVTAEVLMHMFTTNDIPTKQIIRTRLIERESTRRYHE